MSETITLTKAIDIIEAEIERAKEEIADVDAQIEALECDRDHAEDRLGRLQQKHRRLMTTFDEQGDTDLSAYEPIVTPEMTEIARRVNASSPLDEWILANQQYQRVSLAQLPDVVLAEVGI